MILNTSSKRKDNLKGDDNQFHYYERILDGKKMVGNEVCKLIIYEIPFSEYQFGVLINSSINEF